MLPKNEPTCDVIIPSIFLLVFFFPIGQMSNKCNFLYRRTSFARPLTLKKNLVTATRQLLRYFGRLPRFNGHTEWP